MHDEHWPMAIAHPEPMAKASLKQYNCASEKLTQIKYLSRVNAYILEQFPLILIQHNDKHSDDAYC